MTYLRHVYSAAGLPDPKTVALHTSGTDWVDVQVAAEFSRLFPGSALVLNPPDGHPFALHVLVVDRPSPAIAPLVAWGRRHRYAEVGLGVYWLDPRTFEVMPGDRLGSWARRRRVGAAGLHARRRFPRWWAAAAWLYRRCASFS